MGNGSTGMEEWEWMNESIHGLGWKRPEAANDVMHLIGGMGNRGIGNGGSHSKKSGLATVDPLT